jgi:hypothetical protein
VCPARFRFLVYGLPPRGATANPLRHDYGKGELRQNQMELNPAGHRRYTQDYPSDESEIHLILLEE